MGASVRAKTRQAASSQSLLSIKAKRERAIAALQEAGVAIGAAVEVAKGEDAGQQRSGRSARTALMTRPPLEGHLFPSGAQWRALSSPERVETCQC